MAYGIFIDRELQTRIGGNSVFFSKHAEGNHQAQLEFELNYDCAILMTFGFVHHNPGHITTAYLDDEQVLSHRPTGGTVNQQSNKKYVQKGKHTVRINNPSGFCSIFVQGVSSF